MIAGEQEVYDFGPEARAFLDDALAGLDRPRDKTISCKYFYDAEGSRLFEDICRTPEYYLTRSEIRIMQDHAAEMAERLGPRCLLIEYGSGEGLKTRYLLERLEDPAGYVPIDISRTALTESADRLRGVFPHLPVLPVYADYLAPHDIPEPPGPVRRRAIYFPGSTIGNFLPEQAVEFLTRVRAEAGEGGALLIGVDLWKDKARIEAAYDDAAGVTAAFNKNLLARMNRELGADFDLEAFDHRAPFDEDLGRVELYLVSRKDQTVRIAGRRISFKAGEPILTEYSHKYRREEFARLAREAGFEIEKVWTDPEGLMSVQHGTAIGGSA